MSHDFGKVKNNVPCLILHFSGDHQASKCDECVTSPTSDESCREVSKSSSHRIFVIGEECRPYSTINLENRESKLLNKWIPSGTDKVI